MALPLPVTEVRRVSSRLCPDCRSVLQPVTGTEGAYRCPHGHVTIGPVQTATAGPTSKNGGQARRLPSGTYVAQSVQFPEAERFNQSDRGYYLDLVRTCGWFGEIGWVPQASQAGDGRLGPGPAARGGGSKSRRKRKKKGGKKMIGEEWQAG